MSHVSLCSHSPPVSLCVTAGGGFSGRVESVNPNDPSASLFADIEARVHSFLSAHFASPILPKADTALVDESWGGNRSKKPPQVQPALPVQARCERRSDRIQGRQRKRQKVHSPPPEEEEEEEEDLVGLVLEAGRRRSSRIPQAVRKKQAEEAARKERLTREAEEAKKRARGGNSRTFPSPRPFPG